MAWLPSRNRGDDAVVAAFVAALQPVHDSIKRLDDKIGALAADHVTRSDLNQLRQTMQDGFSAIDDKYYRRDYVDQAFHSTEDRIASLEKWREATPNLFWARAGVVGSLSISVLTIVVTVVITIITTH